MSFWVPAKGTGAGDNMGNALIMSMLQLAPDTHVSVALA